MRLLIFTGIIFLFLGCTPCEQTTLDFNYSPAGHIIIPVSIKSHIVNMLFDTGAAGSNINIGEADFNIPLSSDSIDHKLFYHTEKAAQTKPLAVSIGSLRLKNRQRFTVSDRNSVTSVLGNNIIDDFCWLFDFDTQSVLVSNKEIKIDDLDNWIKIPYFIENDNLKYISVSISDSIEFNKAELDTGCAIVDGSEESTDGTCVLDFLVSDHEEGNNLRSIFAAMASSHRASGIAERNETADIFRFDSLKLFGHSVDHCNVMIRENDEFKSYENIFLPVGYITLSSKMYLDTKNEIMYLLF